MGGLGLGLLPKGLRQAQAERGWGSVVGGGRPLPSPLPRAGEGAVGWEVGLLVSGSEQVLLYACGFEQVVPTGFQLPTQVVYIHIHQFALPFADFAGY